MNDKIGPKISGNVHDSELYITKITGGDMILCSENSCFSVPRSFSTVEFKSNDWKARRHRGMRVFVRRAYRDRRDRGCYDV